MCIAILSTAHPKYRLIVINNRDEFLHRPTSRAGWWPDPHTHVLSARDLARPVHGTWLGITKQGRIAILTNYHEDTCEKAIGACSRGTIVNSWLALPADSKQTTEEFVTRWASDENAIKNIGGFNLVCGKVDEPLAVLSNRVEEKDVNTRKATSIRWIAAKPGQTVALSNTGLSDRSWEKVISGEKLMEKAIAEHAASEGKEDEDQLIQRLLRVLSVDTLPRLNDAAGVEDYIKHMPKSIFVPVVGPNGGGEGETTASGMKPSQTTTEVEVQERRKEDGKEKEAENVTVLPDSNGKLNGAYMQGLYGTQKQTVILVGYDGRVRYFERTLYEDDARATEIHRRDRSYEFVIEK